MTQGNTEQVLNTPFATARIAAPGRIESGTSSEAEVRQLFGTTLESLPPAPWSFNLYFLPDSDELTPDSRAIVSALFSSIARRPSPEVVVIGHTDRVGTVEYNDRLSLQRAERASRELIRAGIPAARIRVEGRGEREPLIPTEDEVPEPRNRRVEISVR